MLFNIRSRYFFGIIGREDRLDLGRYTLARNMHHASWDSHITFYDLIFPLFFCPGRASLTFSINKELANGKSKAYLYAEGLLANVNIYGNRYCLQKSRYIIFWAIEYPVFRNFRADRYCRPDKQPSFIWIFQRLEEFHGWQPCYCYTMLHYFISLYPVMVREIFLLWKLTSLAGSNRTFQPGRLVNKIYDENGMAAQVPAHCLAIMGAFAGDFLRSDLKESKKIKFLLLSGLVCLGLGSLWGLHLRVSRHLWSVHSSWSPGDGHFFL